MSTQHTSVRFAKAQYNAKIQENAGSTSFDHKDQQSGLGVFRKTVEQSIRGAKTIYRDHRSAWVYMEGDYMTLGWVGRGDFQTSKNGEDKFVVYSRTIENLKYSDHNKQYHMRMAKDMGIAVKAAKGAFRSYHPTEVAEALRPKVVKPVSALEQEAVRAYRSAVDAVGMEYYGMKAKRTILALDHLVTSGHVFPQADYHKDLLEVFKTKKERDRLCGSILPMTYVYVYERFGKQRVDVCSMENIKSSYGTTNLLVGTFDADAVSDDIQGKVAVMSMCEAEQFVEGVGFKVDDTTFFFYVEDVTT